MRQKFMIHQPAISALFNIGVTYSFSPILDGNAHRVYEENIRSEAYGLLLKANGRADGSSGSGAWR